MSAGVYNFTIEQGTTWRHTFRVHDPYKTVVSITRTSSTATVTCTEHGYSTGNYVFVKDATQAAYNGAFQITVVDANTFTYTVSGSPTTPATGTISVAKLTDLTGYSGLLQIRPTPRSSTIYASLSSPTSGLTITEVQGKIEAIISKAVTADLCFTKACWNLELTNPSDETDRLLEGDVLFSPEVAR